MNLIHHLRVGLLIFAASGFAATAAAKRPNILFIFADDHAVQAISAYQHNKTESRRDAHPTRLNQTPNIDRLATDGALFTRMFCANSICSPSRACVLTGKHSHMNGVTRWQRFNGAQFTFAKDLQAAGYRTAVYGKWHLGSDPTGFDDWKVYPGQGHYYNPDYIVPKTPANPKGREKKIGYSVDTTTDLAMDFIKQVKSEDKPFMLMCQYKAPHRTWMPAPRYLDLYDDVTMPEPSNLFDGYENRAKPAAKHRMGIDKHMRMAYDLKVPKERGTTKGLFDYGRMTPEQKKAWTDAYNPKNEAFWDAKLTGKDLVRWKYQRYAKDYLRCIAAVDENVGRLLDLLKAEGLAENTIVVYSSDQGFYLGEHGWFDKRWMYEESFRMPFLIRWPGVVKANTQIHQLAQNIDFAPTFLEAAGLPVPEGVQGESLMPLLSGLEDLKWRDALYYHYHDHGGEHQVARQYGVRTERYKLVHYYTTDEWELFDLEKDHLEMHNRYADPEYATIRKELSQRLTELQKQYQDKPDKF